MTDTLWKGTDSCRALPTSVIVSSRANTLLKSPINRCQYSERNMVLGHPTSATEPGRKLSIVHDWREMLWQTKKFFRCVVAVLAFHQAFQLIDSQLGASNAPIARLRDFRAARRATDRRLPHRASGFAKYLSSAMFLRRRAAYLRRTAFSGSSSESSTAFVFLFAAFSSKSTCLDEFEQSVTEGLPCGVWLLLRDSPPHNDDHLVHRHFPRRAYGRMLSPVVKHQGRL
ncbi:hypothetical protein KC326_g130 [Hortaea werneckii]|nr:hypothetical protein KC326_g130 [Hortaea werneckii]